MISLRFVSKFLYFFAFFVFVTAGSGSKSALAADDFHDDNRYDGSEFNASSFRDTTFDKTDYKELRSTNPVGSRAEKLSNEPVAKEASHLMNKKAEKTNGVVVVGGDAKGPLKQDDRNRISDDERSGPVHDLPGDWVPNKLDLTSNGGFGIIPDNGSPVPYRLNGHVDIQRGRPWEN